MFKPIKWLFISGAVLGGAGLLLFGSDLPSYIGTIAGSVKEKVESQIPIEVELKRAENLIKEIEPQIESCKRDVAQAEVELEELHASVTHLEKVVATEEQKLKNGARLLSGDGEAGYRLTADGLTRRGFEIDLQRTLDSYRTNQSILKTKRSLIDRQLEAVAVAKERLSAVRAQKCQLEDEIRSLKTQQKWIETMAASTRRFDLDDSALGDAQEALAKVRKRLDVAQKMLENEMVYAGGDPVAEAERRDVLREIAQEFEGGEEMVEVGSTGNFVRR